jgi:LysR family transcriptional regulator, nitrogen assimilation regulatory protein
MFATLAFASQTDWHAILPAIMMADPDDHRVFDIRLIRDPPLYLDLFLVEAARRPMSTASQILLTLIKREIEVLNMGWQSEISSFVDS